MFTSILEKEHKSAKYLTLQTLIDMKSINRKDKNLVHYSVLNTRWRYSQQAISFIEDFWDHVQDTYRSAENIEPGSSAKIHTINMFLASGPNVMFLHDYYKETSP